MKIVTLDDHDRATHNDDPLDALVAIGKRSTSNLLRTLGFAMPSSQKSDGGK